MSTDKSNFYKPKKGEPMSIHFTNKRTVELDVDNRKFESKLDFKWVRSHIYWTSKKRGLRSVTNQKKHSSRFERRKINQQVKNIDNED